MKDHLNPLRQALGSWAEVQGVPFHDLTDVLVTSASAGAIPFFPGDTHLNAVGHAVMAESLLSWDELRPR